MSPAPRIRVDPTLPAPIWSQIEESVRYLVASGALGPGDVLSSVRDLAREQRVNPNTVAKAYQRLVEAGILETRRGEGTFVAARPPAIPAAERVRILHEGATRYTTLAVNLGATRAEAVSTLQAAWPDHDVASKGGKR
ncbi:MAG TPA: GntR family transcriptional regulator [Vicinamibacteria bacterium]|jgi:DNA-binding transcriptional regulator YhcF (GntR family)|nr:GntR family transcriptional regulator [Vicinamibacteria bacterium]